MFRKKSKNYLMIIIIILLCISVGYSILSRNLNITGNSEVKQNSWNIYFDNLEVTPGSVEAENAPVIDNSKLSVDFDFMLNLPGDFYEFTVDIVNAGSIDAMIESISKTPELTEEQKKYMNYIVEYQNGEQLGAKQLLGFDESTKLRVRVEFRKDVLEADMPTSNLTLNLGFSVNYVQADNTGVSVKDNGLLIAISSGSLDDIGTIVTIGTEKFYTIGVEEDEVKLLSMYNLYVGNKCTDSNSGSCTPYGDEATGMQDPNMRGYVENEDIYNGTVALFSDDYYIYLENYKTKLEEKFGVNILSSRLIYYDDLFNDFIGCVYGDGYNGNCYDAPEFIYSTSYWTDHGFAVTTSGEVTGLELNNNYNYGIRPVIVMSKNDIKIDVKPVSDGPLDEVGTIVRIGTEPFYTIGIEGNNVKLLAKYNLYVGRTCRESGPIGTCGDFYTNNFDEEMGELSPEDIEDEVEEEPEVLDGQLGMQSSNMLGRVAIEGDFNGVVSFSSDSQHGLNYNSYSGSLIETYVIDYKNKLKEKFGVKVKKARLITLNELTSSEIGCTNVCRDAPAFIYSTSYWTSSHGNSKNSNYAVDAFSYYVLNEHSSTDTFTYYGVRPVIEIPISSVQINSLE